MRLIVVKGTIYFYKLSNDEIEIVGPNKTISIPRKELGAHKRENVQKIIQKYF